MDAVVGWITVDPEGDGEFGLTAPLEFELKGAVAGGFYEEDSWDYCFDSVFFAGELFFSFREKNLFTFLCEFFFCSEFLVGFYGKPFG